MMLTFALSEFKTKIGVEEEGAMLGVACVSVAKKNSSKL